MRGSGGKLVTSPQGKAVDSCEVVHRNAMLLRCGHRLSLRAHADLYFQAVVISRECFRLVTPHVHRDPLLAFGVRRHLILLLLVLQASAFVRSRAVILRQRRKWWKRRRRKKAQVPSYPEIKPRVTRYIWRHQTKACPRDHNGLRSKAQHTREVKGGGHSAATWRSGVQLHSCRRLALGGGHEFPAAPPSFSCP
jgi:hypothetical protein